MKLKTYLFIDNIVEVFLCTALGLEKKTKKLIASSRLHLYKTLTK